MRFRWRVATFIIRIFATFLWRLRVFGMENIPRRGGVLLASNHQSFLDPPLVGSCLPREMHFMARRTLFTDPAFGALIASWNAFPIDRDSADVKGVKEAITRLQAGHLLLVFPEGTRTRNGEIGPIKPGVGMLAERAAVPIVPVLIEGAYEVWPRGRRLPRLWGRIAIRYGAPLPTLRERDRKDGERIRDALLRLKGETPGCRIPSS